jgi:ankyrin repeat protein
MTVQRLGRLIADGDVDEVRSAVENNPRLVARTVERAGQGGWTPLHVAVVERQPEIARVLVDAGADIGARTEHGRTPLHVALRFAPEVAPVLLELGAVVDAPSAAFLDDVDTLTRQLDGGTRPNDRASGADLLSWAAFGGATSTAKLLLARGADIDGGALRAAAGSGRLDVVRMLVDAGADVDRRDPATGRTALHAVAASPGGDAPDIVELLLTAGADVNATTSDGASALDISRIAAARHRRDDAGQATAHDALAEVLVAHGARD